MPGSNKNSDTNRNINPSNREESGMRGKPPGSWEEYEEEYDEKTGSSGKGRDMGTRKDNPGNTGSSGDSSGGRSGGSSGSR